MKGSLTYSYKTNYGISGLLNLTPESTIAQIKQQLSQELLISSASILVSVPGIKPLQDIDSISSLNIPPSSCFSVATEISEVPTKDYFNQLLKKLTTKDLSAFIEICEEWEESFDIFSLLNSENPEGWTLVHYACYKGVENVLRYMVSKGAMCNSESEDSWTPLQLACYNGHTSCVKELLKHLRLQINRSTSRGTALHQACRKGQADILYLLLDAGACMTIEDSNGLIPLQVASSQEVFEIIPKYMGERLINSLRKEDHLNREVANKVSIEGRDLQMVTNLIEGTLSFYEKKRKDSDNYSKEFKQVKLIDIYDIREHSPTLCFLQGRFEVIEIRNSSCRELIDHLHRLIDYCQINKIGYSSFTDSNVPVILNRSPSRNMSFHRVSISSFKAATKIYETLYCKYFSVQSTDSSQIFLMKQVSKAKIREINKSFYFVQESKMLQHIRHNFISRLRYAFQSRDNLYFIFEHCRENLLHLPNPLSISTAKVITAQVILALEYLHSRDIVYRNLNPASVWLDGQGNAKLMDFEFSKENVNQMNKAKSFVGSLGFVPPEIFLKDGYEKPADIYALGPFLYFLLTGKSLFTGDDVKTIVGNIKLGNFSFPSSFPSEVRDFLSKVMQKEPNLRPNIESLKKHMWLKDVSWNDLNKRRIIPRKSLLYIQQDPEEIKDLASSSIVLEEYEDEVPYEDIEDFNYFGSPS